MRIVIDMQGAQSTSRTRGIGRYTLELTKYICRHRGNNEVILALNGLFQDTIDLIRSDFNQVLSQENIHVWYAPREIKYYRSENDWRRQSAELLREAFLASFNPDVVLVSSLFEGLYDDSVTSIGRLGKIPTGVILYDLIPLIYPDKFLTDLRVKKYYMSKIDHLRRANLLLAISESSRQEGLKLLGIPGDAIVNISSAASSLFQPQRITADLKSDILNRYNIYKPFVMSVAKVEERKNMDGLIRAYALLPNSVRDQYQLVLTGEVNYLHEGILKQLIRHAGFIENEVVLTGYVPDHDLSALYNLCEAFVFPSFHEGFGLPILEAMSCGKAVVCSNVSNMPEVIRNQDALFDPSQEESMAQKIAQVLTDNLFRKSLEKRALQQARKFSWDDSAKSALKAIEKLNSAEKPISLNIKNKNKPRLAYVSPLPPERSGISDYSADLIPELANFYEIDVIVQQETISDSWIKDNCRIRSPQCLIEHAQEYDRILYHLGNSLFHNHMFSLLEKVPGVIVLHDFFYSSVLNYMDYSGFAPGCFGRELYASHGYTALKKYFNLPTQAVIEEYPCNLNFLQKAQGIIVHSQFSQQLIQQHYHESKGTSTWTHIPLLRVPVHKTRQNKEKSRQAFGFDKNDFIICSFGSTDYKKLNHRVLKAWISSKLARDARCFLIFVGEHSGKYGQELLDIIEKNGLQNRVRITGWVNHRDYHRYLEAADAAIQLRTLSRGETSGAILDCMNYGLATIINDHGSMTEIPENAVWKLPDNFDDTQLTDAITTLWQEKILRQRLGEQAKKTVQINHNPKNCATQYYHAIEKFYQQASTDIHSTIKNIAHLKETKENMDSWMTLTDCLARSFTSQFTQKQILLDISGTVHHDDRTGIYRFARSILKELLISPPQGWRVEPVYATSEQGYRYARRFTLDLLGGQFNQLHDDPIEYRNGDIFLTLDLYHVVSITHRNFYKVMRNHGVKIYFTVFDLLPISMERYFPNFLYELHHKWLEVVAESDGVICISRSVAHDLEKWIEKNGKVHSRPYKISWFHLGADTEQSVPTTGMPEGSLELLHNIRDNPTFLMVGTIEPRKGYGQTLAAFEKLWTTDTNINLVIVGKKGWQVDELADKIQNHPESGKRLFWFEGISDEYLGELYSASTCLIAASEGEGFGLPLIEAAKHKIPIIARDIPVFREVAGQHAYYFKGADSQDLTQAIQNWLALHKQGKAPSSEKMPWQTWKQSAQQLWNAMTQDSPSNTSIIEREVA